MQNCKTQGQRRRWTRGPMAHRQWNRVCAPIATAGLSPCPHVLCCPQLITLRCFVPRERRPAVSLVKSLDFSGLDVSELKGLVVARASSSSQSCFNHQLPVGVSRLQWRFTNLCCYHNRCRLGFSLSLNLIKWELVPAYLTEACEVWMRNIWHRALWRAGCFWPCWPVAGLCQVEL